MCYRADIADRFLLGFAADTACIDNKDIACGLVPGVNASEVLKDLSVGKAVGDVHLAAEGPDEIGKRTSHDSKYSQCCVIIETLDTIARLYAWRGGKIGIGSSDGRRLMEDSDVVLFRI